MGFLTVNRVLKHPQRKNSYIKKLNKRRRLNSNGVIPKESTKPKKDPVTIESLPREILEMILCYSANFSLPQASMMLASKLSRSRALELSLIRETLRINDGALPVLFTTNPFVTREVLEAANVSQFCSSASTTTEPYVPLYFESKLAHKPSVSLVAFMIVNGCRVEGSPEVYIALQEFGEWAAVEQLAQTQHRCDHRAVVNALNANTNTDLILALIKQNRDVDYKHIYHIRNLAESLGRYEILQAIKHIHTYN